MFFAIVAFHVYHPGKVLQGPDSTFPSRKEKKALKKREREQRNSSFGLTETETESYKLMRTSRP